MNRKTLCVLLVLSFVLAGCRTMQLVNPDPTGAGPSTPATREAIMDALQVQSWIATQQSPGTIEAKRSIKGRHEMTVAISYNDQEVSMAYVDSRNLKYSKDEDGTEYIHNNYGVWTGQLWWQIQQELARARDGAASGD